LKDIRLYKKIDKLTREK